MSNSIPDREYINFYEKFTWNDDEYNKNYNTPKEVLKESVLFLKKVNGIYVFKLPTVKITTNHKHGKKTLQQDFMDHLENLYEVFYQDKTYDEEKKSHLEKVIDDDHLNANYKEIKECNLTYKNNSSAFKNSILENCRKLIKKGILIETYHDTFKQDRWLGNDPENYLFNLAMLITQGKIKAIWVKKNIAITSVSPLHKQSETYSQEPQQQSKPKPEPQPQPDPKPEQEQEPQPKPKPEPKPEPEPEENTHTQTNTPKNIFSRISQARAIRALEQKYDNLIQLYKGLKELILYKQKQKTSENKNISEIVKQLNKAIEKLEKKKNKVKENIRKPKTTNSSRNPWYTLPSWPRRTSTSGDNNLLINDEIVSVGGSNKRKTIIMKKHKKRQNQTHKKKHKKTQNNKQKLKQKLKQKKRQNRTLKKK
jgi:hypothetical protein